MPSIDLTGATHVGMYTQAASIKIATVFLTHTARIGVIIMSVTGVLSCVLVSTLLTSIIFSALSTWSGKSSDRHTPFISKQVAVFVICLLISDFIQSISGIIQVKWAAEKKIYEGPACSIQAATLVMGDLGSTVWSSVIAAHTFCGLALGKQWSRGTILAVVVVGWSFVIFLTLLGPLRLGTEAKGPFFSIAGTWCFISSEYAVSRLLLHYVPLFIASAVIVVLYGLVYLVLRGTINFTSHSQRRSSLPPDDSFARQRVVIAKRMLWYPIAYLTAIMPIAIIRMLGLKEESVPEGAWILGMSFLFSLGAVDAVIYTWTRHLVTSLSPATQMQAFRLSLALAARGGKRETDDTSSWNPTLGSSPSVVPSQISSPVTENFSGSVTEKPDVNLSSTAIRAETECMQDVVL